MGSQLADMVHPCDHSLLRELFQPGQDNRQVVVRARCAARGKARPAGYMVLRLRGRVKRGLGRDDQVFIGELQSLGPEDGDGWSRHGRDLKITETSPGFQVATGFQASWLKGKSFWTLVHPADVQALKGAVTRLPELGETETPPYRLLCRGGGTVLLVTQLGLRGDEIHCQHNCLLHNREGGLVEAVEQVENRVTREESHMFSVNSKPKRLAAENRVTSREEETSSIFSPHFSDPLLCSINPTSSTVVSVRRQDETHLVLEASGDFLLEEEDAPITILEEVQTAEMEEGQTSGLEVFNIQPLRSEPISFEPTCDIQPGKFESQTTTLPSRKTEARRTLAYYTLPGSGNRAVQPGDKGSVLKYLLQDPEFGKSRIKVA